MRMIDLRTTVDVLRAASETPSGARRRVAEWAGVQPSVVTDRVHRVEAEIGAELLRADGCLTHAGRLMLEHGGRIVDGFEMMMMAIWEEASIPEDCA